MDPILLPVNRVPIDSAIASDGGNDYDYGEIRNNLYT